MKAQVYYVNKWKTCFFSLLGAGAPNEKIRRKNILVEGLFPESGDVRVFNGSQ